jgi:hypothetical protein
MEYIYALKKSNPAKVKRNSYCVVGTNDLRADEMAAPTTIYRYHYAFKPSYRFTESNDREWSLIERRARHWEGVKDIYWCMSDGKGAHKWRAGDRIFKLENPIDRLYFSDESHWLSIQVPEWTCVRGGKSPVFWKGAWVKEHRHQEDWENHPIHKKGHRYFVPAGINGALTRTSGGRRLQTYMVRASYE